MRTNSVIGFLACGLVLGCADFARADLISVTATRDATIYESDDGSSANGAGRYLFAGRTNQNLARRSLLFFDLNGLVPAGAEITSARLHLNLVQANPVGLAWSVSLHRALSAWTTGATNPPDSEGQGAPTLAGDCSWIHSSANGSGGGVAWNTAGGDFSAQASASIATQALGLYTLTSAQLLADVRDFANAPAGNLGWFLLGDESSAGTARRFDSADGVAEGGIAPRLEIEFTVVPTPATLALLPLAGLARLARRRR
jgi:hypothetical protein